MDRTGQSSKWCVHQVRSLSVVGGSGGATDIPCLGTGEFGSPSPRVCHTHVEPWAVNRYIRRITAGSIGSETHASWLLGLMMCTQINTHVYRAPRRPRMRQQEGENSSVPCRSYMEPPYILARPGRPESDRHRNETNLTVPSATTTEPWPRARTSTPPIDSTNNHHRIDQSGSNKRWSFCRLPTHIDASRSRSRSKISTRPCGASTGGGQRAQGRTGKKMLLRLGSEMVRLVGPCMHNAATQLVHTKLTLCSAACMQRPSELPAADGSVCAAVEMMIR